MSRRGERAFANEERTLWLVSTLSQGLLVLYSNQACVCKQAGRTSETGEDEDEDTKGSLRVVNACEILHVY